MSEKNRVEIHDFKDWKAGVYLIEAGCGQGKNYFVFNTLFPYAHENGKRMLVFSNRVALREQQQAQTQEKDVKLITYQSLEHDEYLETMQDTKNKVRGLMQQVGEYDYIILDEAHYLYQDAPFNKNTETIIELIEKYRSSKIIVLLSATPDLLKKYLRIDKPYFFKADYSYIKEVQYYTKRDTLDEIISKIPENEKIVVFADSKDRLKELHSEYPNSAYLDASNKDISSKEKSITDVSITDPIPILSRPSPLEDEAAQPPERKGTEAKSQSAIEIYRQIIMDNIEYEHLCQHVKGIDRETLDEIVDLLVETVCSARKTIRIAGDDYPAELVKSKFMKLDSSHIEFVFDCLSKNTSEILQLSL